MFLPNYVFMQETPGDGGESGSGEVGLEDASALSGEEGDVGGNEVPPTYLRDLTEDDVYSTLTSAREFPNRLQAAQDRIFGRMGPLVERQNQLESSLNTRVSLDSDKLMAALAEYDDGSLAKTLVPALQEALNINPLDETALKPHLEPIVANLREEFGKQLVLSNYTPDELAAIIPEPDENGQLVPKGQKQQDFADWYAQQGYERQQALSAFGPGFLQALKAFQGWEKGKIEEREKAAKVKTGRLNGGQQPSAQGKASRTPQLRTESEGFYSVFKE